MIQAVADLWQADKARIEPRLGPAFGLPVRDLPQVRSGLNGDLQGTRNRFSGLRGPPQIRGVEFGWRILGNEFPQALANAGSLQPSKLSEGAVVPAADPPLGMVGGLGMRHDIEVFHHMILSEQKVTSNLLNLVPAYRGDSPSPARQRQCIREVRVQSVPVTPLPVEKVGTLVSAGANAGRGAQI